MTDQEAQTNRQRAEATRRQAFLDRSVAGLGHGWADHMREELRREGRPASGGWPGTMREARTRVERLLLPALAREHLPETTSDERLALTRGLYAAARRHWLEQCESDPEEDDEPEV
jgi:hypothetical protein